MCLRVHEVVFLLSFVMLQTFIPPSCSLAPPTPHTSHSPSPMDQSLLNAAVFVSLSLLLHVVSFLCSVLPSLLLLLLFLPSGDAAKRRAWKLSRVGSLRSIYTNSLLHSEGKEPPVTDRWTSISPSLTRWSTLSWRNVLHPVSSGLKGQKMSRRSGSYGQQLETMSQIIQKLE